LQRFLGHVEEIVGPVFRLPDMHGRCASDHEPWVLVEGWGTECLRVGFEGVILDWLVLDKGLTGRYLPLAITFIPEELFSTFEGLVSGVGR